MIQFDATKQEVTMRDGELFATATGPLRFGHLGCKVLKTVPEDLKKAGASMPESLAEFWDVEAPGWRKAPPAGAAGAVANSLRRARTISKAEGIELWDTMRGGSDYWRPGKLLSDAAGMLAEGVVTFRRHEALCPPRLLLDRFRNEPGMSFPEYARHYADYLLDQGRLEIALAAVVEAQARGRVPVFYCTDPFIPGYAKKSESFSDTPFDQRAWPLAPTLREAGCHRVILCDLLGARLRKERIAFQLLELDPTTGAAVERLG